MRRSPICGGRAAVPSAPRPLRPQAAVKVVGESHILCYVRSLCPVPSESVTSDRLHGGPSPSALGLEDARLGPASPSRGPASQTPHP